jgi:osmotically-inducible protein OsmY
MKKKNLFVSHLVLVLALATAAACWPSASGKAQAGQYVDDSVITTKVKTLLAANDLLKSFEVGVETSAGVVQLSGFVDSQSTADQAGRVARGVDGVTSVRNDLVVQQ